MRRPLGPVILAASVWAAALSLPVTASAKDDAVNATAATFPNFWPSGATGRVPKWNGSIGTPAGGAVAAVGTGMFAGSGPLSPGV